MIGMDGTFDGPNRGYSRSISLALKLAGPVA